jgi:polyphosphate kinase 2
MFTRPGQEPQGHSMSKSHDDDTALERLEIGLVETQEWAIDKGLKVLPLFEGRDAAGKDGAIHRIIEHLSVRNTRVVALPKPSDREKSEWWFQRYVRYLPAAGEWAFYNRSWYNRSGVETVMGFSTPEEQERFLREAPGFEHMLVESGLHLFKFWLDVSKEEQAARLKDRKTDPLKRLKSSDMDSYALSRWDDYTRARDQTLERTHTAFAPWIIVRADHKKHARVNIIRHLLRTLACPHLSHAVEAPDPDLLFPFELAALTDGRLAR